MQKAIKSSPRVLYVVYCEVLFIRHPLQQTQNFEFLFTNKQPQSSPNLSSFILHEFQPLNIRIFNVIPFVNYNWAINHHKIGRRLDDYFSNPL